MYKNSTFNYFDQTPSGSLKDLNLMNSIDQEQIDLYGISIAYYKLDLLQQNFDDVFRDTLSSKKFMEAEQLRCFFKVDESTTHGMTDIGVSQVAERKGNAWFNVAKLHAVLGREPVLGDVLENIQLHQKFEVFGISKELHRLGVPLRYNLQIRLYQDTK